MTGHNLVLPLDGTCEVDRYEKGKVSFDREKGQAVECDLQNDVS